VIGKLTSTLSRLVWRSIPIDTRTKQAIKHRSFSLLGPLLGWSTAYRDWARQEELYGGTASPSKTRGRRRKALKPLKRSHLSGDTEYVPLMDRESPTDLPVKVIAFYLPQFHEIPENNEWWGEGFTEWTNVRPCLPLFSGHYQPHVPGELGYYTLDSTATQHRQIELAKRYGVGGFCFYYYWFGGKRLLEKPVENFLSDESLDFPFCICWANENWSRRWDGRDKDILIAQNHSEEDDLSFIMDVSRFLRDPRYIRVDGKPVLLIYRPSLLPSASTSAQRWRDWCRQNGIGEIFLACTESFDKGHPGKFGFDAAVEFPPNNSDNPDITDAVDAFDDYRSPAVYDWTVFPSRSSKYDAPGHTVFRTVNPGWDNTARKGSNGRVFLNSTPEGYQTWLANAITDTCRRFEKPDHRLVFVNAWNEWAEGAHLEPDRRYGYAYLQATRNALTGETYVPGGRRRIILVSHDAYPHGAQFLALNLARALSQSMRFEVELVCLGGGPLKVEFSQWAHLHDLEGQDARGPEARALAVRLAAEGARIAIVNTTVSGHFLETLALAGIRCTALIHELKGVLEQYQLNSQARSIAQHAARIICPAQAVAQSFADFAGAGQHKITLRPQGLYKRIDTRISREDHRRQLRELLGMPPQARIVLGVGYADLRKGVDLFVRSALETIAQDRDLYWVWIGHWEASMQRKIEAMLASAGESAGEIGKQILFPDIQKDTNPFYMGADVYALTSREDPFPSVILEAFDASLPVVGFNGAGGFTELAADGALQLVPFEDHKAMAASVVALLASDATRASIGAAAKALVDERYAFRPYVCDLLTTLGVDDPKVSVVVPNFNYAHYLPERLNSILGQSMPIHEVIFLDDCSSDESLAVADAILRDSGVDYTIVRNEVNSGSVFRQWHKGVEMARGQYVWIAEADDDSDPDFLQETLRGFITPSVVMSYCESQQIDAKGVKLADHYQDYVSDIDARHWMTHFANDGVDEIVNYLSVKNSIPNVSAVLFEREALKQVMARSLQDICQYRVAGDWRVYVELLAAGSVAFSPRAFNRHRRHEQGVTLASRNQSLLDEIRTMQDLVASRYPVLESTRQIASQYLVELTTRFGLE
jgi:glycosyltransferase involved in cell wall biosynthesis